MRWRRGLTVAAASALMVAAMATPAAAKGPDQVTITGPGLASAIVIGGMGEPGSMDRLGQLTDACGLFGAMFGPDAAGAAGSWPSTAPTGALGPRYALTWRVPSGESNADTVRQDLYPFAAGGPVVHTAGGQTVFGAQVTESWYRGPASLVSLVESLGVPAHAVAPGPAAPAATSTTAAAPSPTDLAGPRNAALHEPATTTPAALVAVVVVVAFALLAGAVLMVRRRRA